MDAPQQSDYTYEDAGYNGFFQRSIGSVAQAQTLSSVPSGGSGNNVLNFDQLQVNGSVGDTLRVGKILINGGEGNIIVNDGQNDIMLMGYQQGGF